MALVPSLNCRLYHMPLSLTNPNFKFSHSQLSVRFPENHYSSSSSTCVSHISFQGWKLRRRFLVFNNSGEDSTQSASEDEEVNSLGVKAALSMLRFYKREISPLLPKSCRYVPTCSEYSMIAYKKYGFVKGTILTAWRICRCNPLGGSGFDPPRWFDETSPPKQ